MAVSAPTARSITRHMSWVFILGGIVFLGACGFHVQHALQRWSNGEHVDLQGLAAIIGVMGTTAASIIPILISILRDRRIQRVEEIRAGRGPEQRPFSEPNDLDGPRPGENWR